MDCWGVRRTPNVACTTRSYQGDDSYGTRRRTSTFRVGPAAAQFGSVFIGVRPMGANRFPFLGYLAALAAVTGYSTRCAGLNMTEGVVGEYVLASINGAPLPFRIYNSEISHQNIVGGTLSLTDGGVVEFTTESQVGMFGATASRVDSVAG